MRIERLRSAWLVTWERVGTVIKTKKRIAAILDSRLSSDTVRKKIESMYLNRSPFISDRISYLRHKANNPYPAEYDSVDGINILSRIHCGASPWLFARLVDDLSVRVDKNHREFITWTERPRPNPRSRN
jgi:hypothetical protein